MTVSRWPCAIRNPRSRPAVGDDIDGCHVADIPGEVPPKVSHRAEHEMHRSIVPVVSDARLRGLAGPMCTAFANDGRHSNHGAFMTRLSLPLRDRFAVALCAVFLAVPVACGPFHRGQVPQGQIVFVNESIDQADVYAAGPDGNQVRIGTVSGGRTETLTVPPAVVSQAGNITVSARILAGGVVRSGAFSLAAGDTMKVTLPPDKRSLIVLPNGGF
jgi:hypothetical protein